MRRSIALVLLAVSLVVPAAAFAAEPTDVQGQMDVQLWPGAEPGKTIAIVSLILPPETKLPVVVEMPVPEGTTVDWAGEIAGSDPSADIAHEYTLERGVGGAVARFELTKSRQAQIELGGIAQQTTADGISSTLKWVQSVPATAVAFSVRLPTGAVPVKIQPQPAGEPASNAAGESLYTLPNQELKAGEKLDVSVVYTFKSAAPQQGSAVSAGTVVGVLAGVLAVALVILLVALQRQKAAAGAAAQYDDEALEE